MLYSTALTVEFISLVVLRIKEPNMKRPFKVPGGWLGIAIICILPAFVLVLAVISTVQEEGIGALWMSLAAIATGPIAYFVLKVLVKKDQPTLAVPIEYEAGYESKIEAAQRRSGGCLCLQPQRHGLAAWRSNARIGASEFRGRRA